MSDEQRRDRVAAAAKWAGGMAAGVTATAATANASIVYTPVTQPVNAANPAVSVDFNHDGVSDVEFDYSAANSALTVKSGLSSNAAVLSTYPAGVPLALSYGDLIGPVSTQTGDSYFLGSLTLLQTSGTTITQGSFTPAAGPKYLGIQLTPSGSTHADYGWVAFQTTNASSAATLSGVVTGYAYDPSGATITAGAVPEPSALATLAMGAAGAAASRRRRRA